MHAPARFYVFMLLLPGSSFALDFSAPELPWAVVDQPYSPPSLVTYGAARCPAGDVSFRVEGNLPPGLSMTALGQIAGTPGQIGVYQFLVRAADSCSAVTKPMTIVVTGAPILVVPATTLAFHHRRGGGPPTPQSLLVSSNWPDLPYFIERLDAPWLRAAARSGRTPKPGAAFESDRVEVSVEPGSLAPGTYEGRLRFWTREGSHAPVVAVRLVIE
jgi:hypothetical protein